MRYFGKEGPQCDAPWVECADGVHKYRMFARRVLFGRVPRAAVRWLGLGLLLATLLLGVCSLTALKGSSRFVSDQGSAVLIHR
jgi:hypothetical protein